MWRSRNDRDGTTVVCIACGTSLPRSEAREYDKQGNRWERRDKSFEHLCKECYRGLCHQPRGELESLLVDVERAVDADAGADTAPRADGSSAGRDADDRGESGLPADPDAFGGQADAGHDDDASRTFLAAYVRAVEERYGPAEESGSES